MSLVLKTFLDKAVEEDYKRAKSAVELNLQWYKALLLKVAQVKEFDALIWFEGQKEPNQDLSDLDLLEKADLVKGQMRYTHRNMYRRYVLSEKGVELVEKLSKET